ncbi:MAG: magnesium and cobalt transport protein CorA [Propionibacteriaceae bacterium]|jgi:magnesium transporter|nr:magnesium and cobalt transport protein CorA [Propionibacteriaceae bacterium]
MTQTPAEHAEAKIFTAALYENGRRVATTDSVAETHAELVKRPNAMAWVGMYRPTVATLKLIGELFDVHPLALEDAIKGRQRPKVDRYPGSMLTVVHPARFREKRDKVDIGEIHVLSGPNFAFTIRHCDIPALDGVRERMEDEPDLLSAGPIAVVYGALDAVVDLYVPVVEELQDTIDDMETELFGGNFDLSRRIYDLSQQVAGFGRAVRSTERIVDDLTTDWAKDHVHQDLRAYLHDVEDHLARARERADGMHESLRGILSVQASLVAQQQSEEMRALSLSEAAENRQMKRISAVAGILFAPTIITGIYGMNFANMPELEWPFGYLFALSLMAALALLFFILFKRKNWL